MRIAHVVPSIAEEASGPSYSVVRLCESLIDQGQEVTLATLDKASLPFPPPFLHTFPLGFGPRRLGRSPKMKRWFSEQLAAHSINLIHNHSLWKMPNVYSGQVAHRYNTPLVVSPRGTLNKQALENGRVHLKRIFGMLCQLPAIKNAVCFHATGISEYEGIRSFGFRKPVAIIPNGIDVPELLSKTKCDSRTLLFLGRVHPIKGLDILLHAWRAVQDHFPDWKVQIVGPDNGGYLSQVRRLSQDLQLKRIDFRGALFGKQKWKAYGQADLFVLPTYSENFGMSVAEALAAGTPAIVSKGAPWSGLVSHGAGWWVDIGVDPLVACLEIAMALPGEVLEEMGLRGRAWVTDEFAWEKIAQQMTEVYQWVVHSDTKPEFVIEE